MIELEQFKLEADQMREELNGMRDSLDIADIEKEINELEEKSAQSDFWNDLENSQKVLQRTKNLKDELKKFSDLQSYFDDIYTLIELGLEEEDDSVMSEVREGMKTLREKIEGHKVQNLLSGPYDKNNAIITLHSGAGGTEAQDWVQMLYRMFTRWAEKKGYTVEELDFLEGEEAGIKSVSVRISGLYAYGYLKSEKGVHRLVRISPFDASGRRHTSFASAEVIPELTDDIVVEINQEDLRIDTFRASGAGGQHINKTDSAIRITHIPTGIVVSCQNERSQYQNKDTAMKMLKAKLLEIKERENKDRIEDIKGEQRDIAWGSQIRSYVFHPYSMVKDHRTNTEVGNVNAVMDGEIDEFINAFLKQNSAKK
ncbi:MAG: peptide chain release factor 2 [Ignavibacteriales bacterium]